MKTVAIIALLAASRLTALEVLPVASKSEALQAASLAGAWHPRHPNAWTVPGTGSLWPMVRGGDVAAFSSAMPKTGDIGVFYLRPTAAQRAAGLREGWRMHLCVGAPGPGVSAGRYAFRPIDRVGRPYPMIEYVLPSDVIGSVRKVWRIEANSRQ